jgi:succinoglycan biosynthesis transport protein ExoP
MRNPSLSRKLAPDAVVGLFDVLTGKVTLERAIRIDASSNMDFLPLTTKSQLPHTNEILASDSMRWLIENLRSLYDYVIVDLPPLAPVVDVRATTQIIDSYIFVVEWRRTRAEIAERALRSAHGVYNKLLGVVLNKTDLAVMSRYDDDGDYYNKYFARYGYS